MMSAIVDQYRLPVWTQKHKFACISSKTQNKSTQLDTSIVPSTMSMYMLRTAPPAIAFGIFGHHHGQMITLQYE